MRRIASITIVLALAAAACICTGTSPSPTLQPLPTSVSNVPTAQPANNSGSSQTGELSTQQIEQISQAAVEVIITQQSTSGDLQPVGLGSGTIISPEGEILTNCHVACGAPVLVIAMTTNADQPPEPKYLAKLSHADENLDLALINIYADINGTPVSLTDLPYIQMGNSDDLRLGDKLYIFGYPGAGGETITFSTGSVSGFQTADVGGVNQRVLIKTDANISHGNSGGTAVDLNGRLVAVPTSGQPDVEGGITWATIGELKPVNLVQVVRQGGIPQTGPITSTSSGEDPDQNEPNDELNQATGPLQSGQAVEGYISWDQDVDLFYFSVNTLQPITIEMEGPEGSDYDIALVDESGNIAAKSTNDGSSERIEYSPPNTGLYYVGVVSYGGSDANTAYQVAVSFDGETGKQGGSGGGKKSSGITVTGEVVDGDTGRPLGGGTFGLLVPGVICDEFFSSSTQDMSLVVGTATTNRSGIFTLSGVPRGETYSAFFIYEGLEPICEDDWLPIPSDAVDSDLGTITISQQ